MSRSEPQECAIETAWRIHAVLMDWTGKVDVKAAFALSLQSAVLTALAALAVAGSPRALRRPGDAPVVACYLVGIGLLVASVALSVYVVRPQLDRARARVDWNHGFIYFGHLRHWDPADLAVTLASTGALAVVSQQLVDISRICWRKHRMVQWSLALATLGTLLAVTAGVLG